VFQDPKGNEIRRLRINRSTDPDDLNAILHPKIWLFGSEAVPGWPKIG
jgi:hypothetical protein